MLVWISDALQYLKLFLPLSPVRRYLTSIVIDKEWLHYLNWFVPVSQIIIVLEVWLSAVVAYYSISAVLRFFKVIS